MEKLGMSPWLFIYNLAFFLSVAFLAVSLLVSLFRAVKSGKNENVRLLIIVVLVSAAISGFYTFQSYRLIHNEQDERILSQTKQLDMILNNYYSDLLSNIYVIARASAFISADAMNSINERYRPSQIMFGSLAICAVCFICFVLSPNIWWAIAVLLISNSLLRSANTASIYCQADIAENLGYNVKAVSLCSETVKGVFNTVTSPILSLFLALGNKLACTSVGAVCLLLVSGYSAIRKKRKEA